METHLTRGRRSLSFLAALTALVLTACTDLTGGAQRTPVALALDPDTVFATEGDAVTVGLRVMDGSGRVFDHLPSWAQPVWSAEAGARVRVEGDSLRLLGPGASWVDVQIAGLLARVMVRANPRQLALRVGGAYLTQSVQRLDGSVPLVAGRDALLRVFLVGDEPSFFSPRVRVDLYSHGALASTLDLLPASDSLPVQIDEASLVTSWNVTIPGSLIQPGLSYSVEADPEGRVPLAPGSGTRFPAVGSYAPSVRAVRPLSIRLIPVQQTSLGTTGDVTAANMESFIAGLRSMWPLGQLDVDLRVPYRTNASLDSENGWIQLLEELDALRLADRSSRYYYGVARVPAVTGIIGIGYIGWPAALGTDEPRQAAETLAHELGHNFGLYHAPCGGAAQPDSEFPYEGARTGAFGYDAASGSVKSPANTRDIMSYCTPKWVSDYNFEKVMGLRAKQEEEPAVPAEDGLLIWGSIGPGGPVLEPAFELPLAPSRPERGGAYRVEGFDAKGSRIFSYAFAGHPVDHVAGASSFAFALPSRQVRPERLARLRLVGPTGEAWQESRSGVRMALVRDRDTGAILSFVRAGSVRVPPGDRVDVLYSDGVQTTRVDATVRPVEPR